MLFAFLIACLDDDGAANEPYIALQSDFEDFRTWEKFDVGAGEDTGAHGDTIRAIYVSNRPPTGSSAYPVGTRFVHTIEGETGDVDVFAMAKRGDGFNSEGALGWEWFELTLVGDVPVIRWRGAEPPEGEAYGTLPGEEPDSDAVQLDCNGCHGAARANDFIWEVPL